MKKKILVAEDNENNYKLIQTILPEENANIVLLWAQNGEEDVNFYKENLDIDVILMDIQMPVMNGSTAAKKIKEINSDVPIIGVTAYHDVLRDEVNLDDYLEKPFLAKQLVSIIDKHVKDLCGEMLEREDERAKEWMSNETEALQVLTGVSKLLELTDYVSKSESVNVLAKLDEIKDILKKKNGNKNNPLHILLPDIKNDS